jgi:paraquat-inducible protein B
VAEPNPELDEVPQAVARPHRRSSLSLVWAIPLVAALIGGWLAVKTYLERGPTITVTFKTAEGLEANKTRVKYKDVEIGEVKAIRLADDRSNVEVTIELAKYVTPMLVADSRFWVVRPRIGAGGVSGLGTLFSGAYIGMDVGKSSEKRRQFVGLEQQPIVAENEPGRSFVLRSQNLGSLNVGDPLYFRRVRVGAITDFALDKDGKRVTLKAFVGAPYDQYVTTNTRFWHASGIDVTLGVDGLNVRTEALATMLAGGISFQEPPTDPAAPRAEPGHEFQLVRTREEAMRTPDPESMIWVIYFEQSVRGVSRGAPVELKGVPVGEIADASLEIDETMGRIRSAVTIRFYPQRLWSRVRGDTSLKETTPEERKRRIDTMVAKGLRAQLRSGNLLTGQYFIALEFFPNAKKATVDWTKDPPVLPSEPGALEELQASVMRLADKLEKIPYAEISADVRKTLASLDATLKSAEQLVKRADAELITEAKSTLQATRAALENARSALESADRLISPDAPLATEAREALRELGRAAEAMRVLADQLERHPETVLRGKAEEKQP